VLAADGGDLLLELRELAAELAAPRRHARLELGLLLGRRHVERVVDTLELAEALLQPLHLARVGVGQVARLALERTHLVEQVAPAVLLLAELLLRLGRTRARLAQRVLQLELLRVTRVALGPELAPQRRHLPLQLRLLLLERRGLRGALRARTRLRAHRAQLRAHCLVRVRLGLG